MKDQQLPADIMERAVKGISYISHPLRLRILEYLDVYGPSAVKVIAAALDVEPVFVSQALKKMREAHLVKTNRRGVFIYYDIFEEYPASIFVCIRKLFGFMSNQTVFLQEGYKAVLPTDYTMMVSGRIKLFANYEKMRILDYLLIHGESNVSDIAHHIECPQVKVSQYLKRLKEDEFVSWHREGRCIYYSITKGIHKTALQCIHRRYDLLADKSLF